MPEVQYLNNIIAISDTHCGCRSGLYPCDLKKPLVLDQGAIHEPSKFQLEAWNVWKYFWSVWVPKVTRREDYAVVVVGDALDGRHHGAVSQISQNINDQLIIAKAIFEPIIAKKHCKALYWIRGTEAHVGPSAELEEILARELNAVPDKNGKHSRWTMWARLGGEGDEGALIHFAHHIGVTGSSHYESSALNKEVTEQYVEGGRWLQPAADITIRAHRHRYIEIRLPSARNYTIGLVLPGWQGKTPFSQKVAGGRQTEPQLGGVLCRKGDEEHYTRAFVVGIEREKEEIVSVNAAEDGL